MLWSALGFALSGCDGTTGVKPSAHTSGTPQSWAYEKEFTSGPVSLTLRVEHLEASLADKLLVEQELRSEAGFIAEFPEYLAEDFEGFSVVDIALDGPSTPASSAIVPRRKRLTLEPDRSGELFLAPLAVYFYSEGDDEESSFLTDEVAIEISAPDDTASLALKDYQDIFMSPPDARAPTLWIWMIGGAIVVASIAFLYARRRRGIRLAPPVPPEEIAYEALRRLVSLQLVEKGEVELFFVHLSRILREYIENRFTVRAPERTTEEFLMEAATHEALQTHRKRLAEFLGVCDQVKFARFEPDEEVIQHAFDVVRRFLSETSTETPGADVPRSTQPVDTTSAATPN